LNIQALQLPTQQPAAQSAAVAALVPVRPTPADTVMPGGLAQIGAATAVGVG
jgi:hypothetical protein